MKYTILIALCLFGAAVATLKEDFDTCTTTCKTNRDTALGQLAEKTDAKVEFAKYNKCAFNQDPQNGEAIGTVTQSEDCKDLAAITDFTDANIKTYRSAVLKCNFDCMDFSEEVNEKYESCTDKCMPKLISDQKVKTLSICFDACHDEFENNTKTLSQEEQLKIVATFVKFASEKACQNQMLREKDFENSEFLQKMYDCNKAVYKGAQLTSAEKSKFSCEEKCVSASGSNIKWEAVNGESSNTQIIKFTLAVVLALCSLLI